ncbi:MAG TPA: thiamine diphosphokinase [Gammaproteobacteria bacterium]|nr:thiamine diphosphokinase [Gammaproteobacteria bacterium]
MSHNAWLVIAHGEPVPEEMLLKFAKEKSIMVLDGAYSSKLEKFFKPNIVLGDFDHPHEMPSDSAIKIVHVPDQDATDLEKGLLYLAELKAEAVTLVNATGWRLDHTLYNLRLLKRFHRQFKSLKLMTALEQVFYVENTHIELTAMMTEPLALLSFPQAVITSKGLQYDMNALKLEFGLQESTSNHLLAGTAHIEIDGGALLLVSHGTQVLIKPR